MPNITITTETGSTYEIDITKRRVRRLDGKGQPTARMGGKDGSWRTYAELEPERPIIGRSLRIIWGDDVKLLPETQALVDAGEPASDFTKATITSPVRTVI